MTKDEERFNLKFKKTSKNKKQFLTLGKKPQIYNKIDKIKSFACIILILKYREEKTKRVTSS